MIENEPQSLSEMYPDAIDAIEYAEQVAYMIWPLARELVATGASMDLIVVNYLKAMDSQRDRQITIYGRDPAWLDRARQQAETGAFRHYIAAKIGMV